MRYEAHITNIEKLEASFIILEQTKIGKIGKPIKPWTKTKIEMFKNHSPEFERIVYLIPESLHIYITTYLNP